MTQPNRPRETFYAEPKADKDRPPRERRRINVLVTWASDKQRSGRYWQFDRELTEEQLLKVFRAAKAGEVWLNLWDNGATNRDDGADFASAKDDLFGEAV